MAGLTIGVRSKGLVVVDAVLLQEATNNSASLDPLSWNLCLKDPLAPHNIGAGRSWDKAPCPIINESLVLVGHRSFPVRICESAAVVQRKWIHDSVHDGEVHPLNRRSGGCKAARAAARPGDVMSRARGGLGADGSRQGHACLASVCPAWVPAPGTRPLC